MDRKSHRKWNNCKISKIKFSKMMESNCKIEWMRIICFNFYIYLKLKV